MSIPYFKFEVSLSFRNVYSINWSDTRVKYLVNVMTFIQPKNNTVCIFKSLLWRIFKVWTRFFVVLPFDKGRF